MALGTIGNFEEMMMLHPICNASIHTNLQTSFGGNALGIELHSSNLPRVPPSAPCQNRVYCTAVLYSNRRGDLEILGCLAVSDPAQIQSDEIIPPPSFT